MNGVTGRMGTNQHLLRSILAIREEGGVERRRVAGSRSSSAATSGSSARSPSRTGSSSRPTSRRRWRTTTTPSTSTPRSPAAARPRCGLRSAPASTCTARSRSRKTSSRRSSSRSSRRTPASGTASCRTSCSCRASARSSACSTAAGSAAILAVRGEFGYWVFPGPDPEPQRPSWNYRAEDGGGIVADMFSHWRYVLDELFGSVRGVFALGATHLPVRHDEQGEPYDATAEDAAYAIFQLDDGVIAQINSSWCVRVDRGELFELQVDGTDGSAVAGLRECRVQPGAATPRAVWNPDLPDPIDHRAAWLPGARRPRPAMPSRSSGSSSCATWLTASRSRGTSAPRPAASSSPSSACGHGASSGLVVPRVPTARRATGRCASLRRRPRSSPTRPAHRLGRHARLPPPPVGPRARRRRGDGHRPARHGPRLAGGARADPPHGRRARRPAGGRGGHRPHRAALGRRRARRLRAPVRVRREHRRPGDRDGEPRARRPRHLARRLPRGLRHAPGPARAPRDPALARRHVRPRARRILGLRGPRRGRRHPPRDHRGPRRQGRRRQGLAARRAARGRRCASGCPTASASTPATTSTTPS